MVISNAFATKGMATLLPVKHRMLIEQLFGSLYALI